MWQYNTRLQIARICRLRVRVAPLLSMTAHDTYADGHGRMRATMMRWIPVVDEKGAELDDGELVTYLNDAILLAPSMLLGPEATFSPLGENSIRVTLNDRGRSVSAAVILDERRAPVDFRTTDRFVQDPSDRRRRWQRCEWRTPVDGWQLVDGRPIPTSGRAIWQLPRARSRMPS
jgi:hypothetical protein